MSTLSSTELITQEDYILPWTHKKDILLEVAHSTDQSIKLHTKDNWICKFLAWFLYIISLGKANRNKNMTSVAMTIANHIYIPKEYTMKQALSVIFHESQHVKQFRMFGFYIHPLLGIPLNFLAYCILPIPVYGAIFRVLLERDADHHQFLLSSIIFEWTPEQLEQRIANRIDSLSGPLYLYALPKKLITYLYRNMADEIHIEMLMIYIRNISTQETK